MAGQKYVLVVDDDSAFPEGRTVRCEVFSRSRASLAASEKLTE